MKISRKLFLSNFILSLVIVLMLTAAVSVVIRQYIYNDVRMQLVKDSKNVVGMIENLSSRRLLEIDREGNIPNIDFLYKRLGYAESTLFIYIENQPDKLIYLHAKDDKWLLLGEENQIRDLEEETVVQTTIFDKPMLVYKETIDVELLDETRTLSVVTMVYDSFVGNILKELMWSLAIVIVGAMVLSLVATYLMNKRLIRPIDRLLDMTKRIRDGKIIEPDEVTTGDELASLAESMYEMSEALKMKAQEQKQFYEQVSHDLKTPLTVISGYAEGLGNGIFDSEEDALSGIVQECNGLKNQIEDLIYYSSTTTQKAPVKLIAIELNELIGHSLNRYETVTVLKDIDLIFEPEEAITLWTDKDKLMRLMDNIISNCVKHARSSILIQAVREEKGLSVTIRDDGLGFSEKLLAKPFEGWHDSDKVGSGIGLMIIKAIADELSIDVMLSNAANGGAVYRLHMSV